MTVYIRTDEGAILAFGPGMQLGFSRDTDSNYGIVMARIPYDHTVKTARVWFSDTTDPGPAGRVMTQIWKRIHEARRGELQTIDLVELTP